MDFQEFKKKYQKIKPEEVANSSASEPLVSICVQTFQHVNFIKDCLDGILMQETSFPFEVLLGEDASMDGTREICKEYAKKYPGKIRLFLHHRENNIKIGGQPTGRFNFLYNLFASRGKYIALCEGDDYWTDPLKLQKQVNFMEENEDFGICFHPVQIFDQEADQFVPDNITKLAPETTNIKDLAKGNYIHTPSVLLRNNFTIPKWYTNALLGDWTLYMIHIKEQKIKCIYEKMAIYRTHSAGLWSKKSINERKMKTTENVLLLYKKGKFEKPIRKILKSRFSAQMTNFNLLSKLILRVK